MIVNPQTVEEYIAQFPDKIQKRLGQIRNIIKASLPEVEEKIRYGMLAFKIGKEHIYLSAYKKHIGMYPMYGLNEIEADLKPYRGKATKDALHFPHGEAIPLELIKKIILTKYQISN
jgi:uncharacterized protein YdhG (YjbR/CyaY superfamily)